jgi:hypothetical protein
MRCIFCLCEKHDSQLSKEHVFPEAIGGTMIIREVCKPCNDYLGHSIDTYLTNHWFTQAIRQHLGIKGKSKKVPNVLENGVLVDDPYQKVKYKFNAEGKPESLYVVPHISSEELPDGSKKISIKIDSSERYTAIPRINKMRARMQMSPLVAARRGSNSVSTISAD